jgi:DNA-binding transcriptional MerR regulator
MKIYKPNEFGKLIGVCVKTLQRWDNAGKFKAFRTPSNKRFYTDKHLEDYNRNYMEGENK